ncbi:MAG: sigma-70 family RNA polymerase sigma factor [Candidatus Moranbacteria bacterium]|nr:sigma-70 family RNA polymerase sigma factor [Candidatus Moranbacteria bacterium]NTW46090.1 sigma-70 family RNA polymerase sigma factor [Candidatus Moranbacteria bacterium]
MIGNGTGTESALTKPMDPSAYQDRTDIEIIGLAKQDANLFGVLMERYEAPLLRYIRRISSFDRDDAEDILQEAFIKAYRNLNDFDHDAKFSSWIYRIVHNQTIDTARKKKIRTAVSIDEHDLSQILRDATDIEDETARKHDLARLNEAVRNLPETYREALILRFLEEKSYEEIMDILRLPKGTVATLIRRGRKILLDRLAESPS